MNNFAALNAYHVNGKEREKMHYAILYLRQLQFSLVGVLHKSSVYCVSGELDEKIENCASCSVKP